MSTLLDRLEPAERTLLRECGELARDRGYRAYVVGGAVRDLMLGLESPDLDVLVEGDAIVVAQDFAREHGAEVTRHHVFQTATVHLADKRRLDFATARSEQYRQPGSLPNVVAGTLLQDLGRRDFTINTLAVRLDPEGWGTLEDPFDGAADIEAGRVRFLHEGSFRDDPTRLLRALRFALRFGYELEPRTADGVREAAEGGFLETLTGDRLRRELAKLLDEQPVAGPIALADWKLLAGIHPGLRVSEGALARLAELADDNADAGLRPWQSLGVLAAELTQPERWDLVRRLRLPKAAQRVVVDAGVPWDRLAERLGDLGDSASAGTVVEAFDELSPGAVAVGAAVTADAELRARARRYLRHDRHVTSALDGDAVLALGCPPGPAVGRLLRRLRRARLDGEAGDAEAERALAKAWLQARN